MSDAATRSAFRFDGLADALAPFPGYAGGASAAHSAQYAAGLWGDVSGELLYAEGGLAAVIVDRPAADAMSRGWDCEGDEAGLIADEWSRLDVAPLMDEALRYSLRDGAAAVLVLCEDGPSLAEPLREDRVGTVTALRPLSGARMAAGPFRYADPMHPRFGQATTYRVRDPDGGGEYDVHETRLLRVPGEPMARARGIRDTRDSLPWSGRPRLAGRVGQSLRRYQDTLRWLVTLLERKQQPVHQAAGLGDMLAAADMERKVALSAGLPAPPDDAYAIVRARARSVDLTRGILGTVIVDGEDKFSVLDLGLSGTGEVTREMKIALSADSQIPVAILFGESAKGLNATGESDLETYFGYVGQVQNRQARPGLERLTYLLWKQDAFRAREPDRWRVVPRPLWQPSEATQAETAERTARARKANADALAVLAELAVATPEEIRAATRAVIPEWGLSDGPAPDTADDGTGDADGGVERIGGPAG